MNTTIGQIVLLFSPRMVDKTDLNHSLFHFNFLNNDILQTRIQINELTMH